LSPLDHTSFETVFHKHYLVGVPTSENGQVEHINTYFCCYISLWS